LSSDCLWKLSGIEPHSENTHLQKKSNESSHVEKQCTQESYAKIPVGSDKSHRRRKTEKDADRGANQQEGAQWAEKKTIDMCPRGKHLKTANQKLHMC